MLASRSTRIVICHSKVPRESCCSSLCEHKGQPCNEEKDERGEDKRCRKGKP
ncbi:hypothetical protein BHE74_00057922 [Ensete ventricosum]|nr:hypothetical protein BHE74_00057922 [Ensete ventricosum]RZS27622.1 hypothetical protein BHM03_00061133 [Ensete ventricosum]